MVFNKALELKMPEDPLKGKNPFGKTYAYTGQYEVRDGRYRPVGIGRMIFDEDNTIMEGNFKGGLVDGYARYIKRGGDYYLGSWKMGKKEGNGTDGHF